MSQLLVPKYYHEKVMFSVSFWNNSSTVKRLLIISDFGGGKSQFFVLSRIRRTQALERPWAHGQSKSPHINWCFFPRLYHRMKIQSTNSSIQLSRYRNNFSRSSVRNLTVKAKCQFDSDVSRGLEVLVLRANELNVQKCTI